MNKQWYIKEENKNNIFPVFKPLSPKEEKEAKDTSILFSVDKVYLVIEKFLSDYLEKKKEKIFFVFKDTGEIIQGKEIIEYLDLWKHTSRFFHGMMIADQIYIYIEDKEDVEFFFGCDASVSGGLFIERPCPYDEQGEVEWVNINDDIKSFVNKWMPKHIPFLCDYVSDLLEEAIK